MTHIVINKLQVRLAIELAAQHAAQLEIKKQVQQQLPDRDITVSGCDIDIVTLKWFTLKVAGHEVMWED
jgi:ribosomal protein L6P/L9E